MIKTALTWIIITIFCYGIINLIPLFKPKAVLISLGIGTLSTLILLLIVLLF